MRDRPRRRPPSSLNPARRGDAAAVAAAADGSSLPPERDHPPDDSTSQEPAEAPARQIRDVKALALLVKPCAVACRADRDLWVLQRLLTPMPLIELVTDKGYDVLDLSLDSHDFAWTRDDAGDVEEDVDYPLPPSPPPPTDPSASESMDGIGKDFGGGWVEEERGRSTVDMSTLVRLTPSTRIHWFASKYRVVVILDVSSSMRTVDVSEKKARVLVSHVFELLCKCLDGISRPFTVKNSFTGSEHQIHPEIYVTAIAEAGSSDFRPDANRRASALYRKYPIHTLIQDVQITSSNLFAVAECIADALNDYENDIVAVRQMDASSPLPVSITSISSATFPSTNSIASTTPSASSSTSLPSVHGTLDYGLLALRLLPSDCQPVLILLTDGVSMGLRNGDMTHRDALARIARENIYFSVIQTGSDEGFRPGVNFGHVADNEGLRFLAIAGDGRFMYGGDCRYMDVETITVAATPETFAEAQPPPNFFHRHILVRETRLRKSMKENRFAAVNAGRERSVDLPRARLINTEIDSSHQIAPNEIRFPWDVNSKPPLVAEILCGYKDYLPNVPLEILINGRINEGFLLRSVNVTRKPSSKFDKLEIILARPYLPNVTVHYTLKAVWADASVPLLHGISPSRPPRTELNILAQHAFAIQFVSVGEEKSERLARLRAFLKGVCDADETLKKVTMFKSKPVLATIPRIDPRTLHASPSPAQGQESVWQALCHFVATKTSFLDWEADIILRPTSASRPSSTVSAPGSSASSSASLKALATGEGMVRTRLPSAFLHFISDWSSFPLNRQTYVRFVGSDVKSLSSTSPTSPTTEKRNEPTGFAVLKLVLETDWILSLRLGFFNCSITEREALISDLTRGISNLRVSLARRHPATYHPVVLARKPLHRILVRYVFREDAGDDGVGEPTHVRVERSGSRAAPHPQAGVRACLRMHRWVYLADVASTRIIASTAVPALPVLLFELIQRSRMDEGFLVVARGPGSVTLYTERVVPRIVKLASRSNRAARVREALIAPRRDIVTSLQFVVLLDRGRGTVVTELWAEAVSDGPRDTTMDPEESTDVKRLFRELQQSVAKEIGKRDRGLVERLCGFDKVWTMASFLSSKVGGLSPLVTNGGFRSEWGLHEVNRPFAAPSTEFDVAAVLPGSVFATAVFHVPDINALDGVVMHASFLSAGESEPQSPVRSAASPALSVAGGASVIESQRSISNLHALETTIVVPRPSDFKERVAPILRAGTNRERIGMTLHRFLERALSSITDTEVPTRPRADSGCDVVRSIQSALRDLQWGDRILSADVSSSVCYAKVKSATRFLLVLLPFYPSTEEGSGRGTAMSSAQRSKIDFLTVSVFDCRRLQPKMGDGLVLEPFKASERGVDGTISALTEFEDEEEVGVRDGTVVLVGRSGAVTPLVEADEAEDEGEQQTSATAQKGVPVLLSSFMATITSAYAAALCRTVFFTLLQGLRVEVADLDRALGACTETKIDIELTGFLNVQILKERQQGTSKARAEALRMELRRIQLRFRDAVKRNFKPLSGLVGENRNVYFYNPEEGVSSFEGLDASSARIVHLLEVSNTPMFIRTECSFRKVSLSNTEHTHIPVYSLPVSYRVSGGTPRILDDDVEDGPVSDDEEAGGALLDFTPHVIGTERGPIESGDGTVAILHIVCLALPKVKPAESPTEGDAMDDGISDHRFVSPYTNPKLSLPPEHIAALKTTEFDVKRFLEDEIMCGLLSISGPSDFQPRRLLTQILRARHEHNMILDDSAFLDNASECCSSFGIFKPLLFIGNSESAMELMEAEFPKVPIGGGLLSLLVSDDVYRIVLNPDNDSVPASTLMASEGLGIDVVDNSLHHVSNVFLDEELAQKSFWLGLSFLDEGIEIYFFSRALLPADRTTLLQMVLNAVTECCNRVNRLMLLARLHATHKASKYLIVSTRPDKDPDTTDGGSSEEEEEQASFDTPTTFEPGCFSCPVVHRRTIPIHWRVKPSQVLPFLETAFGVMAVTNRKGYIVLNQSEDGRTFYLKLSLNEVAAEVEAVEEGARDPAPQKEEATKVNGKDLAEFSPKTAGSPNSRNPLTPISAPTPGSAVKGTEFFLLIDIFGVDPPGREVIEFTALLEARAASLTQIALSTFLSRNITAKLTKSDVKFVLPVERAPAHVRTRREWIAVPPTVKNPLLLVLLLKQVLQSLFLSLAGGDVANALRRFYEGQFGLVSSTVPPTLVQDHESQRRFGELSFGDLSFLYNSINSRNQTPFEGSVGIGIACLSLALINKDGLAVFEFPFPEVVDDLTDFDTMVTALRSVESNWSAFRVSDNGTVGSAYRIVADVWGHGAVNVDFILESVIRSFNDSLYDYAIEVCVRRQGSILARRSSLASADSPESDVAANTIGPTKYGSAPPARQVDAFFSEFVEKLFGVLELAAQRKNVVIHDLNSEVKLPSRIIEDFAAEVLEIINENKKIPPPVFFKKVHLSQSMSDLEEQKNVGPIFEVYRPARLVSKGSAAETQASRNLVQADRFVVVVGLREFLSCYGTTQPANLLERSQIDRKNSFDSDSSGFSTPTAASLSAVPHSRWPSMEDSQLELSAQHVSVSSTRKHFRRLMQPDFGPTGWSRSAMDEVMNFSSYLHPSSLDLGPRSCFLIMTVDNSHISGYTYNWNRIHSEAVFSQILRSLSWNNIRMQYLDRYGPSTLRSSLLHSSNGGDLQQSQHGPMPHHPNAPPTFGISYSSSYGGLSGLGSAAMHHFGERAKAGTISTETTATSPEQFRTCYSMDADVLQRHAVEFLDVFVRQLRLPSRSPGLTEAALTPKTPVGVKWSKGGYREDGLTAAGMNQSLDNLDKLEENGGLSVSDLASILRSVQLNHSRYPVFFSENCIAVGHVRETLDDDIDEDGLLFDFPPTKAPTSPKFVGVSPEITRWYLEMVESYLKDYRSYLCELGMEVVANFRSDTGVETAPREDANVGTGLLITENGKVKSSETVYSPFQIEGLQYPRFTVNSRLSIEVGVLYVQKALGAGVVIVQLSLDDIFATINMYTLKYPTAVKQPTAGDKEDQRLIAETEDDRHFRAECNALKSQIHLNSFSYDFHIRYVQKVLEVQAKEDIAFDLLDVIRSFYAHNSRRPGYSRCRLIHGELTSTLNAANLTSSLFQYILKNPQRYGFLPVIDAGLPTSCYLSSKHPDFAVSRASSQFDVGAFTYTVVIYCSSPSSADAASVNTGRADASRYNQSGRRGSLALPIGQKPAGRASDQKMNLHYFLFVIDDENMSPMGAVEAKSHSYSDQRPDDVLREYLSGGCYLGDVAKFAEKRMETLLEKAVKHYGRDSLWRQILSAVQDDGDKLDGNAAEWTRLFLDKIAPNSRALVSIDPSLLNLFGGGGLPWDEIFEFLTVRFHETCRVLAGTPDSGMTHLVLFNPKNSDYLIHFVRWKVSVDGVPEPADGSSVQDSSSRPAETGQTRTRRTSSNTSQRSRAEAVGPIVLRLGELERLGVALARPGEQQVDVFAVSREGVADEIEYWHIGEVVNAISFWLWRDHGAI